jgi:3-deoxy-D-manno-octulosonate 8-phosphate phosphatase (KDO 8-P phosphatase)
MNQLDDAELRERAQQISLLILDVDGVLTDGSIFLGAGNQEFKRFHVRDGAGIKLWQAAGHTAVILSGRASEAVQRRANELSIPLVRQGISDKAAALSEILHATQHTAKQTAAIGDDLPDLPVLSRVNLAIAVADACSEVREAAHHATILPGGQGAVREAIEWLLKLQGRWSELIARYQPAG